MLKIDWQGWDETAQALRAHGWIFAKTMPDNPHWYTLRKVWDDPEFVRAVNYIRTNGFEAWFWRKAYVQFDVDEYTYWTMGNPMEITKLINRTHFARRIRDVYRVRLLATTPDNLRPLILAGRQEGLVFRPGTYLYRIAVDGETVGMAGWKLKGSRRIELRNSYILPEYRGRGYYHEALDLRLEMARERGHWQVEANCTPASLPTFLKRGFVAKPGKPGDKTTVVQFQLTHDPAQLPLWGRGDA